MAIRGIPDYSEAHQTVYHHLLTLYASENKDQQGISWAALPAEIKQRFAPHVQAADLMSIPQQDLREAIQQVAFGIIRSLSESAKARFADEVNDIFEQTRGERLGPWDRPTEILENLKGYLLQFEKGSQKSAQATAYMLCGLIGGLNELTPEVDQILSTWVKEGEGREEDRASIERSLRHYLTRGDLVNRHKISLGSERMPLMTLPPCFDRVPFSSSIRELDLWNMHREGLSSEIFKLKALQTLSLSAKNKISLALPSQIEQLTELTCLKFRNIQVQEWPDTLHNLQHLNELEVNNGDLTELPPSIFRLSGLTTLKILGNELPLTISCRIANLSQLKFLQISYSNLQGLPHEICYLSSLEKMDLSGNSSLQSIPDQVFEMPRLRDVHLDETGLTERVFSRLRASHRARTRVTFSTEHFEPHSYRGDQIPSIDRLLSELFRAAGEPLMDFPHLRQHQTVARWISRLADTADYQRGGDFREAFAKKMVSQLQRAETDEQFRSSFLATIEEASQTCGDRVALSIIYNGITSRLKTLPDLKTLSEFLVKTVWGVELLESISREKIKAMSVVDEIEVYLGYPIQLREKLGLEIEVNEMLHFRFSYLTAQDLKDAEEFVMMMRNNEDAKLTYLASHSVWLAALENVHSSACQLIANKVEAADTIEEGELLRLEELKKLTQTVLANLGSFTEK